MFCSTFGKADIFEHHILYQTRIYMSMRRLLNALTDRPVKNFIMRTDTACDVIYLRSVSFTLGSIGMTS